MASGDDMAVARELGAMNQSLSDMRTQLGELVTYQKAQNGRLAKAEAQIAVLEDRGEHQALDNETVRERLKEVESRGRMWIIGIGGPVLAALIALHA